MVTATDETPEYRWHLALCGMERDAHQAERTLAAAAGDVPASSTGPGQHGADDAAPDSLWSADLPDLPVLAGLPPGTADHLVIRVRELLARQGDLIERLASDLARTRRHLDLLATITAPPRPHYFDQLG